MTAKISEEMTSRCRNLRISDRLSTPEIVKVTGLAKSTVSLIVRDIPLSPEELRERRRANAWAARDAKLEKLRAVTPPAKSKYIDIMSQRVLTTDQKGAVSEAAAAFRAKVWGFIPHLPMSGGGRSDLAVYVPDTKRIFRVQVKTARRGKFGAPLVQIRARRSGTYARYEVEDFDVVVAYDPETDRCFVYMASEIARLTNSVTLQEDAVERWDKLLEVLPP